MASCLRVNVVYSLWLICITSKWAMWSSHRNYVQGEPYCVLGSPMRALCNKHVEIIVEEWRNIV